MNQCLTPLDRLIHELSRLPGIGQKTALRLALHILRQPADYAQALAESLTDVAEKIRFCSRCFHLTEADPCVLCADLRRNQQIVCVVEESSDLLAIERTREFRGVYHVLQGALSPLDGIGPENLKIGELLRRLRTEEIRELILATNPNVTGDATALYISKMVKPLNIRVTKLAAGIPVGGNIEYIDQMTLARALESRMEY
ncbi:MAG: recombination protein RecR [Deltaproteobacteria bacterium]|nr:recombination protein RecR [Deltaproteobacteria bacterium]